MSQHFDLIVIGSGPAGRRAAFWAAKLKKSVPVIERGRPVEGRTVPGQASYGSNSAAALTSFATSSVT
jgi:succinate dehydrogenase/fumarate reductase flavoprotein subunit